MGVDLGAVRIGVAICESPELPAVPLATIHHTNRAADIQALLRLAAQRGAGRIVIGHPLRMDASPGPAADHAAGFARELGACFSGEVVMHDERFTTALAAKRLRELPLSGSKRRKHADELAAVEILNGYLAARGAR